MNAWYHRLFIRSPVWGQVPNDRTRRQNKPLVAPAKRAIGNLSFNHGKGPALDLTGGESYGLSKSPELYPVLQSITGERMGNNRKHTMTPSNDPYNYNMLEATETHIRTAAESLGIAQRLQIRNNIGFVVKLSSCPHRCGLCSRANEKKSTRHQTPLSRNRPSRRSVVTYWWHAGHVDRRK